MGGIYMKKILLKVLTGAILMTFLLFSHNIGVEAAQITKTLDIDTRITPSGTITISQSNMPTFKKGTTVILNEYGEVIEGTLSSDKIFPCVARGPFYYDYFNEYKLIPFSPNRLLNFKGGTRVIFNDKEEVIKGTLADNAEIPITIGNSIRVSKGEISFHNNGIPAFFTLGSNTYLRPLGWQKNLEAGYTKKTNDAEFVINCPGFVEFKEGMQIELNDKGEVLKGTLNKDTNLLSPIGNIKLYEAGTTVEFDDQGTVLKASKVTNAAN